LTEAAAAEGEKGESEEQSRGDTEMGEPTASAARPPPWRKGFAFPEKGKGLEAAPPQ